MHSVSRQFCILACAVSGAATAALPSAALAASTAPAASTRPVASPKVGVDVCARAALAKHPGTILQAVLKQEKGAMVWELEIREADNKLVDVECSGATGKLVEHESRVASADDPAFKAKAKVSEEQARQTALKAHPGEVEHVNYEIESDGRVSYEFDIKTDKGDMRVEVDAESGRITEVSRELLEIGVLPR